MNQRLGGACGIALDGTTLTVVWRSEGPSAGWQWMRADCDGTPDGIVRALAEVAHHVPAGASVSVTLLRPLANARALTFPPMARAALERVLVRDWARYVIGMRATPHTVTARQTERGRWRAVFAPTDTLDALADAARDHGWRVLRVQASDDALAAFVATTGRAQRTPADHVVLVCEASGPRDAVHLRGGEPRIGRRFPATATAADALAFLASAHEGPGSELTAAATPVTVIGAAPQATALARAVGEAGHHTRIESAGLPGDAPAEALLAAAGTTGRAALPLLSSAAREVRARKMSRLTRALWLATAAALIVAFAIERWNVNVALEAARLDRSGIAAPVGNLVRSRAALEAGLDAVVALSEHEANASRAGSVLAAIAIAVPPGTSLSALGVIGDSVVVEGEGRRSTDVYDALQAVPLLERVRLATPLRQERQAGDVTVERFAFTARLRRTTPPPGAPR